LRKKRNITRWLALKIDGMGFEVALGLEFAFSSDILFDTNDLQKLEIYTRA
jgi:hypothetical protein